VDTGHAGCIICRLGPVAIVSEAADNPQIVNAIIVTNVVDMINLPVRPVAVYQQPSQPAGIVPPTSYFDLAIAFLGGGARYRARRVAIVLGGLSSEHSSLRAVVQKGRYVFASWWVRIVVSHCVLMPTWWLGVRSFKWPSPDFNTLEA